jgi:transposase
MKLYVGLDVGLEETSLCIVDSEGQTVRELKVSTEPEAIRSALESSADRLDRVGVEASSLGIWLYRELQPAGVPIIVVEARHMRVSLSTMRNKIDRNDARHCADDAPGLVPRRSRQEHRHAEDAHTAGQSEAAQAQADRYRKPHSWRAAGLWVTGWSRRPRYLRSTHSRVLERSDPIFAMTKERF